MTLAIAHEVGEHCITLDQGQLVYDRIHPELRAGRGVTLDFRGVRFFASPFFNASIGQLFKDIEPKDLDALLNVLNLNSAGSSTLQKVIENSREYFKNPKTQAAIDKAISDKASDN